MYRVKCAVCDQPTDWWRAGAYYVLLGVLALGVGGFRGLTGRGGRVVRSR